MDDETEVETEVPVPPVLPDTNDYDWIVSDDSSELSNENREDGLVVDASEPAFDFIPSSPLFELPSDDDIIPESGKDLIGDHGSLFDKVDETFPVCKTICLFRMCNSLE